MGVLVPNLFLYATVEAALRSLGLTPVRVAVEQDASPPKVVIVDLDATGAELVVSLAAQGVQVLAFASHTGAASWARLRQAGAVVLPKGIFFRELPALLESSLAT
ncbi:MAG: hypothetical protein ACP5NF_02110 [Thermoanaerobaculum sp.]